MIGSLNGKITLKTDKYIIIEAGGVGYKVSVSPDTLSKLKKSGDTAGFWIHTQVREDAIDLYGFPDRSELEFFEMLLGVPGIGPRSALAVLSVTSLETLRRAIGSNDIAYLTKVSGIGRKTAEKIVIELRDKIGTEKEGVALESELDALAALQSLGYSQREAREALKKVSPDTDTNAKIREALKILGSK